MRIENFKMVIKMYVCVFENRHNLNANDVEENNMHYKCIQMHF